ncbi:MAG: ABC transporter substrate-binding protein, partial [Rubrivivax sp.]|nr:ABC transporter substrate-binding protein [Rubrivivax sp.]
AALALSAAFVAPALAGVAPDALVRDLSVEIIDAVKADPAIQAGDVAKVIALVDAKVLPYLNFQRMTASAVGLPWRQATPAQKEKLQAEFKLLLVRTYAGALSQVKDQTVHMKPFRAHADDDEVLVRTEVKGGGEPIQLDYRLEKSGDSWKIYDVNVLGIWLVNQYKSAFGQEVKNGGIDGLIAKLAERNKAAAK